MFVKNTLKVALLFFVVATFSLLLSDAPAWALTAQVTPQNVPIKLFYNGAKLKISGESDVNDDLVVKISSELEEAHMKYKGKAAGLFWIKIGDISFEHVPTVYLLASSGKLNALMPVAEQIQEGIGFESIKAAAEMESSAAGMDSERWIKEFIKFKKAEKLYQIQEGKVKKEQGSYQLDIKWPFQAAPGTYNIEVLAVRDGKVVDRNETSLTVAKTGLVATLSNLAFNHAAVYGIIAIVVAMAAGFAVGALFKGGGGAH